MGKQKIELVLNETYLVAIKNSVGTKIFRNLFARVGRKTKDITENGNLSCAFYVSSILYLFKLIKEIHATVNGTVRDLKESGWVEIKKPKNGCVLVWEEKKFKNGNSHKHIGFYIGNQIAISNNSKLGYPTVHRWTTYDNRKIETILGTPILSDKISLPR